jgi:hypothetical protein
MSKQRIPSKAVSTAKGGRDVGVRVRSGLARAAVLLALLRITTTPCSERSILLKSAMPMSRYSAALLTW